MKALLKAEIEAVQGGLTSDQGATLEMAVAGVAVAVGSGGLALVAIGAAALCYEIGDN